jgi:hypothetical protein
MNLLIGLGYMHFYGVGEMPVSMKLSKESMEDWIKDGVA